MEWSYHRYIHTDTVIHCNTHCSVFLANLMRTADATVNNPEFQIQNEDFPALPGVSLHHSISLTSIPFHSLQFPFSERCFIHWTCPIGGQCIYCVSYSFSFQMTASDTFAAVSESLTNRSSDPLKGIQTDAQTGVHVIGCVLFYSRWSLEYSCINAVRSIRHGWSSHVSSLCG